MSLIDKERIIEENGKEKSADKYSLILTEEQISIVERACELYARLRIGQFDELEYHCYWSQRHDGTYGIDHVEEFRYLLSALERIAFPKKGRKALGFDIDAEIAWNIYQATRYCHAWNVHPEGGITVDFHKPLDISGVGIPTCEVVKDGKDAE